MTAEKTAVDRAPLSVAIITWNETGDLPDCLRSVSFADEVVIVDSGSTDDTVAISREFTEKVYETDFPGFGLQKNRALDLATGDWVLSLDADERVSVALRDEIEAAMAEPEAYVAFDIPRLSSYCGKFIRHSGWWPDYVTRLFRRGEARFSDVLVHERLLVDRPTDRFRYPLIHETCRDLDAVLDKMNSYSSAGAKMMKLEKRKGSLGRALSHGLWSFIHAYVIRLGFLDGREGFMLAVSNAEGTYYRYLKRMLLDRIP